MAVGIQIFRVPDRTPPPEPPQVRRPLTSVFAKALTSAQASTLELTIDEVNAHLRQALLAQKSGDGGLSLQHIGVRLEPGKCEILTVQKWHGWNLHLGATYSVSLKGGKLKMQLLAGNLGRLRLSARWMRLFENPFTRMLSPLRRERVLVDRLDDIKLDPAKLTLYVRISAGASNPAP